MFESINYLTEMPSPGEMKLRSIQQKMLRLSAYEIRKAASPEPERCTFPVSQYRVSKQLVHVIIL